MGCECKGECIHPSSLSRGMENVLPKFSYFVANRCTVCSESSKSIWFLKWVKHCPCCKSILRRKSKHSETRQKVTEFQRLYM